MSSWLLPPSAAPGVPDVTVRPTRPPVQWFKLMGSHHTTNAIGKQQATAQTKTHRHETLATANSPTVHKQAPSSHPPCEPAAPVNYAPHVQQQALPWKSHASYWSVPVLPIARS